MCETLFQPSKNKKKTKMMGTSDFGGEVMVASGSSVQQAMGAKSGSPSDETFPVYENVSSVHQIKYANYN